MEEDTQFCCAHASIQTGLGEIVAICVHRAPVASPAQPSTMLIFFHVLSCVPFFAMQLQSGLGFWTCAAYCYCYYCFFCFFCSSASATVLCQSLLPPHRDKGLSHWIQLLEAVFYINRTGFFAVKCLDYLDWN